MGTTSAPAHAPPVALTERLMSPPVIGAVLSFLAIVPVAAGQGGYFPVAWGWMGLSYAWVGAVAVALRREIRLSVAARLMLAGALFVSLWTTATLLWTSNTTVTVLEAEHALAYLGFVAALLVTCQRGAAIGLLVGSWAAITLVGLYSLGTRLLPASFGSYQDVLAPGRLFQPLGYWNALGIFCAMGIAVGLGLTDRPGRVVLRGLAGASIAPLAATTYFTFSRGAWIALAVGVAAVVVLNPRRLRYVATALIVLPLPALAVAYAASIPALTSGAIQPAVLGSSGSHAALVVAGAAIGTAALTLGLAAIQSRVSAPPRLRQAFAGALVFVALAAAASGIAHYGSPITQGHRLYNSLTGAPLTQTPDLNTRFRSLSLNDRPDMWKVAIGQFHRHPIAGGGAGTFGGDWLIHRRVPGYLKDAHSLYIETLGEQGVVGVAALLLLLVPPLVCAVRLRARPEVTVAFGAYVAFLVHAGVDWDWEVSAVTLIALSVAVSILISGDYRRTRPISPVFRGLALAGFVAIGVLAVLGLASNRALSDGESALTNRDAGAALADAHTAGRFAPWSDAPDILAGRAQLIAGHRVLAKLDFMRASREEPADWVAWQWLARSTTGAEHVSANAELRRLDPLYDFADGRP